MELYTSKLTFDSNEMINEINRYYDTSSVSNDNLKMESYNTDVTKFSRLKYFNEAVLPIFDGVEFDNIFLFFAQPSGGLFWHKDGGHEYRRFILPVISNEKCINHFRIDEVEHQMRFTDGVVHWFDSQKIEHNVINNGDTTRVTFLFDVIYNEDKFKNILQNSFDKHIVFN
jgi:hypothetical protein